MAAILTHVFSCCWSRKPSKSKVQDEESYLIPPNTDIIPSYSSSPGPTFNARMLDIVRSKESKMVNVAARIPFHFHNKNEGSEDVVSTEAPVEPSSVPPTYPRSVSASSLPRDLLRSRLFLPRSPMHASQFHMSRSSSMTSPNDSSMTRIYPENQGDEGSGSGSRVRTSRSPAFNIRLVRERCLPQAADISGVRRGRPRKKANSENDDSGVADDLLSGTPPQPEQNSSQTESPGIDQVRSTSSVNTGSGSTEGEVTRPVSPASTTNFDIGPLVIGWAD